MSAHFQADAGFFVLGGIEENLRRRGAMVMDTRSIANKPEESEPEESVTAYHCPSCDRLTEEEPPPMRECSNENCGAQFVAEERECPDCNRPFTRRLADYGCEECTEEMEEVEAFKCGNPKCEHGGLHLEEEDAIKCGGGKAMEKPAVAVVNQKAEETVGNLPTPADWPKYCEVENWHPAAMEYPLMDDEHLRALAADIQAKGLFEPIVLYEGKVLDGRNRLLACRLTEGAVEPRFVPWSPDDEVTVHEYVASKNLHRRHLTPEQWAERIRKLAERIRDATPVEPGAGQTRGLKRGKARPVSPNGQTGDATPISEVELERRVAKVTGKSRSTVRRALKAKARKPEENKPTTRPRRAPSFFRTPIHATNRLQKTILEIQDFQRVLAKVEWGNQRAIWAALEKLHAAVGACLGKRPTPNEPTGARR
jgi:hypothetical protein